MRGETGAHLEVFPCCVYEQAGELASVAYCFITCCHFCVEGSRRGQTPNNFDMMLREGSLNDEFHGLGQRRNQNEAEEAMPPPPPRKPVAVFRWCFISISSVRKQTEGTAGLMWCRALSLTNV